MSEFSQLPFVACRATNKKFQGNKFLLCLNGSVNGNRPDR